VKRLGLPVEFMASSAGMGIEKPDPEFFRRVAGLAGLAPDELVYVGDRVDNDVLPPLAIGMGAVLVRRGPWAEVQAEQGLHAHAPVIVDSLDQLPAAVEALDQPG
jgi:FMN phosphatase YigB (HAD superfamily)